eukprot:356090-Chlamydomonas_euryale.AAC.1
MRHWSWYLDQNERCPEASLGSPPKGSLLPTCFLPSTCRSNLWDIARARQLFIANISKDWDQLVLSSEFVADWVNNATEMVGFVRDMFPVGASA